MLKVRESKGRRYYVLVATKCFHRKGSIVDIDVNLNSLRTTLLLINKKPLGFLHLCLNEFKIIVENENMWNW